MTVEFVRDLGSRHLVLRVHGRDVGETPSCGTGGCAAVAAAIHRGHRPSGPARYAVDAPGGRLLVDFADDGAMPLTGPAYLTAQGTVRFYTSWPTADATGERDLQRPAYGASTPALLAWEATAWPALPAANSSTARSCWSGTT
ncbi:hypothetical protein [Streptomyces sp. NPDC097981]|uniref:hypothetical protein n=1 Tax=Streptomyces sp. NPDC097981 TaxID=3155428 RepID=UPI003334170D